MFVSVLLTYLSVHHMHSWWLQRLNEGDRSPSEIRDRSKLSCGCWGPNLGPLQEELALLTAESSLRPLLCNFQIRGMQRVIHDLGLQP